MTLPLDHVVIAVADLDKAMSDYARLGFTVLRGGEHPGRGSHNALVVFADGAYLELIAFTRAVPEFRWWQVLDRAGEGFVDFALLPDDIDRVVATARARGFGIEAPEDGARARPDGVKLAWKMARAATSDVPFLCGDVTPRALRVPEGAMRVHANGVVGVGEIVVAVADVAASAKRYAAYLGATIDAGSSGAGTRRASLRLSGCTVTLVSPSGDGAEAKALETHLAHRGDGPCKLVFTGGSAAKPGMLDSALTHGARLEIAGG